LPPPAPHPGPDSHADTLLQEFGFNTVRTRELCLELANVAAPAPGADDGGAVLEVGTGSGWMAVVLARAGWRVVSVDVDQDALREARIRLEDENIEVRRRIIFLEGDGCQLPFPGASFSHVFSFDAMHHMPDCAAAIAEMFRVCRHRGTVAVADLNQRGLAAVRALLEREGRTHEENECRVDAIGGILGRRFGPVHRHDLDFVTLFVAKKKGEPVDPMVEKARDILRNRRSFAVIGASADPERYGFELLSTLRKAGYTVYPVNPRYTEIDGVRCYASLGDLPEDPEVVVCALAPHNTEKIVPIVAERGVPLLWLPPECWSDTAVARAHELRLTVIHDLCPIGQLALMNAGS